MEEGFGKPWVSEADKAPNLLLWYTSQMEKLLEFTVFLQKFREVKRMIKFKDGSSENDAEHSFQLAVTAWYIVSTNNLKLNLEKILMYALAHDLVEAYAGDTPAIHKDYENERGTKKAREEEAARRMHKEFGNFKDLHEIIERYEERDDEESRFVYALDKMMPVLNIYLQDGYSWKINNISIDDVVEYKKDKIAESGTIKKYFDEVVPLLRKLPGLS